MRNLTLLGTGLMGAPMARTLARAGFLMNVYNRNYEKAAALAQVGITPIADLDDAIASSDTLILMLSDAQAVTDLLLLDKPNFAPSLAGKTIIQMGTISPDQSRQLQTRFQLQGATYLEALVLGSIPEAREGRLIVMVGATPEQFERFLPVFNALGNKPLLIGEVGQATAVKLAMNQLIGSLTAAFSLSLAFVRHNKVNVDTFMTIVRDSALYAPTYDKKLTRMLENDYSNANFPTKHLYKDIALFNEAVSISPIDCRVTQALAEVLQSALQAGLDNTDYSALYQVIASDSSRRN